MAGGRTTRPCSMPGTRTFCMKVNRPVTLAGMSRRATDRPTIVYDAGSLSGAWESIFSENVRPRSSSPYVACVPPERDLTVPFSTTRSPAGMPSRCAACRTSARRAVAAAWRICIPPFSIDRLPDVTP
jgi:hypothetical protein